MLESKRPRSPLQLRRTGSMKDVSPENRPSPPPENRQQRRRRVAPPAEIPSQLATAAAAATIKLSPFLGDCSLCNSHLLPSHDIFMYRGEAFCSLKCRQQLINHDIKKEKLKLFIFFMKKKASQASEASGKAEETMAAA